MTVLITGGAGLLGSELCATTPAGHTVVATLRRRDASGAAQMVRTDLADPAEVDALFADVAPNAVVHTAYSTADLERDVVDATRNIAAACARTGARLLHLSTDALFSGLDAPYFVWDPPAPVHSYGEAKAQAERDVITLVPDAAVVRTSLICSFVPPYGANGWIVETLEAGKAVTLYANEIRCPIMVGDLARQIWDLIDAPRDEAAGFWHLVGPEAMSRVQVGRLYCRVLGLDEALITEALSDPSRRPADLTLVASDSPLLTSRPRRIAMVGRHGTANG